MAKQKRLDWEAIIYEHEKSGKSVQEFCKDKQMYKGLINYERIGA